MPPGQCFFYYSCRSRVYPCNFIKKVSTAEVFLRIFCTIAIFKWSGNFLRDIFAKHFLIKSQARNLWRRLKAVDPFHATDLFWYALKTLENQGFSDVFRGYQKRSVSWNWLIVTAKFSILDNCGTPA